MIAGTVSSCEKSECQSSFYGGRERDSRSSIYLLSQLPQVSNDRHKLTDAFALSSRDRNWRTAIGNLDADLERRDVFQSGSGDNLHDRLVANSTLGNIDDSSQSSGVSWIVSQLEV